MNAFSKELPAPGSGGSTLQALNADFEASDFDVKKLLLSLVTSDAFRYRKVEP